MRAVGDEAKPPSSSEQSTGAVSHHRRTFVLRRPIGSGGGFHQFSVAETDAATLKVEDEAKEALLIT